MPEEDGYYEQVGDVQEWRWKKGHEPKVDVPEGEFDPRAVPEPEPKPKAAQTKPKAK
jgi:hypothetical protein